MRFNQVLEVAVAFGIIVIFVVGGLLLVEWLTWLKL